MRNIPTSVELLEIIAEYLRSDLSKRTPAPDNFYLLVAANSLDIVRREIQLGSESDQKAQQLLSQLLGCDGNLADLEKQLADRIRSGKISHKDPALIEYLMETALAEMAIDQPKYASYRHALSKLKRD